MKVTYIGHSGFLVETGIVNLLFDYSEGEIPQVDPKIPFFVFVSHVHKDHYNPAVFALVKQYKDIRYFISKDVRISEDVTKEYKLTQVFINECITFVPAGLKRIIPLKEQADGHQAAV